MTVRSVFIISPAKRVELILVLPGLCRPQLQRDPARPRRPAALGEVSRRHPGELAARRRHRGAALHLRRGGGADVRGPGRRPQGALLPALRPRSVAQDLLRTCGKDGVVGRRSKSDRTASAAAWASALRSAWSASGSGGWKVSSTTPPVERAITSVRCVGELHLAPPAVEGRRQAGPRPVGDRHRLDRDARPEPRREEHPEERRLERQDPQAVAARPLREDRHPVAARRAGPGARPPGAWPPPAAGR